MMTKEIINEIDDLTNALENLKNSDAISKNYNEQLSKYIQAVARKVKHFIMFYKIDFKSELLGYKWTSLKKDYKKLPEKINTIILDKKLNEFTDLEKSRYYLTRNSNATIYRKEWLLKKYDNLKIECVSLNNVNDVVFTFIKED